MSIESTTSEGGFTRGQDSFQDNYGITIHTRSWVPSDARAVVQIAHGIGEHSGRYDAFASALARAGFAVYADDHRGHGKTGHEMFRGDLSKLGRLGVGGLRAAEEAVVNFTELIASKHRGLPLVYFGHSWGSLMGQRILNRGAALFDGVVLSGSAYRMPGYMESGDLNKRHAHLGTTGFEWLSRDPAVAQSFAADDHCFPADVLKLFGPIDGLRLFGVPGPNVPDIPMLIMSGSDDALARKDSLERLAAAYLHRGVADVTLKIYLGGRHEMLNETNRTEVVADVIGWLNTHVLGEPVERA